MGIHKEIDRQNQEVEAEEQERVLLDTLQRLFAPIFGPSPIPCPECDRDNLNEAKTKCFDCEGIV